jgi:Tfp pilus assembly protein PilV
MRTSSRRGATLIELLVALLLLDLALLSLASVGALTVRRIGDATRRSRAALAATNRLERLSALPCAAMQGGFAQLEPGVTESWSVRRDAAGVELADSIDILGRASDRVVIRRRSPCG